jgi:hypothetical protein
MHFSTSFSRNEMASVFRKSESQYWFASFKDRQGVWRNKSTQTTNKTDARRIAETLERVATRKLSAQRAAEAIRELYHDLSGEGAPKATVREFSAHWIRNKNKTVLKYLAAPRVLKYLGAQFAYSNDGAILQANGHCPLGAIVTEAKLLTTEVLGKPLLNSDQEWVRAQSVVKGVMAEYQREIDWLRIVFSTVKF